mmetsp:Transcript_31939/g.81033  ORF Transcript_31939/g.81033 Transcript_31939/m.81033 type:complete len:431 (+) Transcript_31939:143-1435(+)
MDYIYQGESILKKRLLSIESASSDTEGLSAATRERELLHDGAEQWQAGTEARIDPYTEDLVIVTRKDIPLSVIQHLNFVNPKKHDSLVTEFEYGKASGEIYYDIAERDNLEDDGYARLITLNWWYQALSQVMLNASLILLDLYSNFIFGFNLVSHHLALRVSLEVACFFPLLYVTLEGMTIHQAHQHTLQEWKYKTSAKTGNCDLICSEHLSAVDRHHAFYAMVLFQFIGLDSLVRDIVVWLHPFKSVQPFCAFKSDGHRCYVIGWANEYMFRCDSATRQHVLMITQVGVRLTLLIFKTTVAIRSWDLTSLGLCVPSLLLVVLRMRTIWSTIRDRQQLWMWLNREWSRVNDRIPSISGDPFKQESAQLEATQRVLTKQKSMHFPDSEWGSSFKGWRNMCIRFLRHVFLPMALLSVYIFVDLAWVHLTKKT